MNYEREDRIYELQQALLNLSADRWVGHLELCFPDDESIHADVLERLQRLRVDPSTLGPPVFAILKQYSAGSLRPDPTIATWLDSIGYDLLEEVGRGGMGIVYKVRDRKRDQIVALKTLQDQGPSGVARFKREFRALADVSHPNLAALYDVVSDSGRWCFTMEFVDGVDFLTHVRGGLAEGACLRHTQCVLLRSALQQLAAGLGALHTAGKLHRDVKPTNVLVTPAGRLVLVDFGLTAELGTTGAHHSAHDHLTGTVAYMSPEHAAGQPLTPASDWYSVGVVLFEALTGQRPFEGPVLDVLKRKVDEDPPVPSTRVSDLPSDLDQLCGCLLRRDPDARIGGPEAIRFISASRGITSPPKSRLQTPLVGRQDQLRALVEAFAVVTGGRAAVVLIGGQSGAGKTLLLQHFLTMLRTDTQALVFEGRCYEQESVPYKTIDSAIDEVARHIAGLPAQEAEALLPRDIGPLTRVFPAFLRVPAVASARRARESPDLQELRSRAFAALRELFGRLGDRRAFVIAVDDLQWGDLDSASLLSDVLRPPNCPAFLFVGSYRNDEGADNVFVRTLTENRTNAAAVDMRQLSLPPLTDQEIRQMVVLLTTDRSLRSGDAEDIARESGGNAFLASELVQYRQSEPDTHLPRLQLHDLLIRRVAQLPVDQRRVLEVISVCGRPIEESIVLDTAGANEGGQSHIRALKAARLIRTAVGGAGIMVETYHDRVRETIRAGLNPSALESWHCELVRALNASLCDDPEIMAVHHAGARQWVDAGRFYTRAADRAAGALAFDRAVILYEAALAADPGLSHVLGVRLGDALANAGRGAEAARQYLQAANHSDDQMQLRLRAATQFLISGRVDEGLATVATTAHALGLRLARTPGGALLSLIGRRILLRARGFRIADRAPGPISDTIARRWQASWSIATGLSLIDPVQGASIQALNMRLALQSGEPYRLGCSLALEAMHSTTGGRSTIRRTNRLLGLADQMAVRSGEAHARGMVRLAAGTAAYGEARWEACVEQFEQAFQIFREECVGVAWESASAHYLKLYAMTFLGDISVLAEKSADAIRSASERGDLYLPSSLGSFVNPLIHLAADDPATAQDALQALLGRWSQHGFHLQRSTGSFRLVETALYNGDTAEAAARLDSLWTSSVQSHLHRIQIVLLQNLHLRARTSLALAVERNNRSELLRRATRDARSLERTGGMFATGLARLIRAGVSSLAGEDAPMIEALTLAAADFDKLGMTLYATVARRRMGTALGGDDGTAIVRDSDRVLMAQGIRNPRRLTTLFAPGFPP